LKKKKNSPKFFREQNKIFRKFFPNKKIFEKIFFFFLRKISQKELSSFFIKTGKNV